MVLLHPPRRNIDADMGRHKEWRKIAKRERRRRIRTLQAKTQEPDESSEAYKIWQNEQEAFAKFELEQIKRVNEEENEKWVQAEIVAMEKWRRQQQRKEFLRQERLIQEAERQMEWELEQEKKKKEEERLKEIEEENRRKQENFMKHLEEFLSGDSTEPPPELMVTRETKPDRELCPFFAKTSCCRFGDQCSRNHIHPGISKVLLIQNFFTHFGLENSKYNEYDTDLMLEYEESDTYKEFKEFFYDILPEFEKFGRIVQLKVCKNFEKHVRGNTYVEYSELRCALAAYRSLHSRWYGGRQISVQFCNISSWFNAICGLESNKRCPFGRACNFLHVFRNPNNMFSIIPRHSGRLQRTPRRVWRWSESPDVELPSRRRSRSKERRRRSKSKEGRRISKSDEKLERSKLRDRREISRSRRRRSRSRNRHRRSSRERRPRSKSRDRRKRSNSRARRQRSKSKERRERSNSKENRDRSKSSDTESNKLVQSDKPLTDHTDNVSRSPSSSRSSSTSSSKSL